MILMKPAVIAAVRFSGYPWIAEAALKNRQKHFARVSACWSRAPQRMASSRRP